MKKILFIALVLFLAGCRSQVDFSHVNKEINLPKTIESDIQLPNVIELDDKAYTLTWSSSDQTYLTNEGIVTRPHFYDGDKTVHLIVTITHNNKAQSFEHIVIVKAQVETAVTYEVTYYDDKTILSTITYNEGESIKKPNNPIKQGYLFEGWFEDKTLQTPYQFGERVFSNITIYAKFTKRATGLFKDEFNYPSENEFLSVWDVFKAGNYELDNHIKLYEETDETSFKTTFDPLERGRYILVFDFIQGQGGASFTIEALNENTRLFTVGGNRQNRYTYRLSDGKELAIPLAQQQITPNELHRGVVVIDMDSYMYKYFVIHNDEKIELTPKGGVKFIEDTVAKTITGLKLRTAGTTTLSKEPFVIIDEIFFEQSSTHLGQTSPNDPEEPINWAVRVEEIVESYIFYNELLTYDILLPTLYEGVWFNWISSDETILTHDGKIFRTDEDQVVSLKLIGTKDDYRHEKTFDFTIKAKQEEPPFTLSHFDVVGFAENAVSIPNILETDPRYVKVYNELEFIEALARENTKTSQSVKIIEIMADLNLGYNEVINKYPIVATDYRSIFQSHNAPSIHPVLLESGISKVRIEERNASRDKYGEGLMIFSKDNKTIKHATFHVKRSNNIIFRNLTFDELWEWDEKGDYDSKDWDYFTIEAVHGIWFDHITLHKAYDGLIDFKYGTPSVTGATFSYLNLNFQPNDFIRKQLQHFEQHGGSAKYKTLRDNGMTLEEITKLVSFQKKGFLLGGSAMKDNITELTIYNSTVINLQDRFPRLRGDVNHLGGDVHVFNNYYDATDVAQFKLDANTKWNQILDTSAFRNMLTNQAIVTTENGAILVENTIFKGVTQVIKSNQTTNGEAYTGKFLVLNSYYELYDYKFTGSSTDVNTPFKPSNPDPIIPFSFNAFDTLPYQYQHRLIDIEFLSTYLEKMQETTQINWLKTQQ